MGRKFFLQDFEYGESDEGYWNYDQIFLQIEDFTIILKSIYLGIDFIFLFDYSCGHDSRR